MTWWKVSTEDKKSVYEHELWQKDDWVIRRVTGFRWGTVLIETDGDNPPVLDQTDGPGADGVDMYNTDYNWELDNLSDGWYEDFIWPDEMPEEERDRLLELWEEDGYGGWEEDGWDAYETECWFHGPLEISRNEELDNLDEEITFDELAKINPADEDESITPKAVWPFPDTPTKEENSND